MATDESNNSESTPPSGETAEGKMQRRKRSSASNAAATSDLRKQIFRAAVDNRWTLLELARESASLEDVFRNLTTGEEVKS